MEQHIMAKPSISSGRITLISLRSSVSGLMFFQGSVVGPKSDDPIDSTFPEKEADSVCLILFFSLDFNR